MSEYQFWLFLQMFFMLTCYSSIGHAQIGTPKGFLISVDELYDIRDLAADGIAPHSSNVNALLSAVNALMSESLNWPELSGEIAIPDGSSSLPIQLSAEGGRLVYGTALAWHLTGNPIYAEKSREMIIDLLDTYEYRDANRSSFHWGSQGILNLARGGTPYIYAADLLESWDGWLSNDKLDFQIWLRDEVYSKVSWASRVRKNNWGVAGSLAASAIAFYLMDQTDWLLEELNPVKMTLTPQQAFDSHNAYQLGRQSTAAEWKMDARGHIWGIMPNGGIPEEIRRGNDPADSEYLASTGAGTDYTMTYIEHLVAHAEFLRRRGDTSLYDHVAEDGSGSLLQAILFVVDNHLGSHCFTADRRSALYMAYDYYNHYALLRSIQQCGVGHIMGQRLALYGRLSHPVEFPTERIPWSGWEIYNAEVLPDVANPVWTSEVDNYAPVLVPDPDRADNNFVRFNSSDASQVSQWFMPLSFPSLINGNNIVNPNDGITVCWTARAIEGVNADLIGEFLIENGTYKEIIRISNQNIELVFADVSVEIPEMGDTWNIYRARIHNTDEGALIQVHVNRQYMPVLVGLSLEASEEIRMGFGDFFADKTIAGDIDWMVWDATGSYHPLTGEPLPKHLGQVSGRRDWFIYDATTLPAESNPTWQGAPVNYIPTLDPDDDPLFEGNKFLTFKGTDVMGASMSGWKMNLSEFSDLDKGMTVVWRLRPWNAPELAAGTVIAQLNLSNGVFQHDITITTEGIALPGAIGTPSINLNNFNDWAIFRATMVNSTLNIYIMDMDEPVLTGTSFRTVTNERSISIGDFSYTNAFNVKGQWDWIIWNPTLVLPPDDTPPLPVRLNSFSEELNVVSSIGDQVALLKQDMRLKNYPNPFRKQTSVSFDLPGDGRVTITLVNLIGQVVATLITDKAYAPGSHSVVFDSSGIQPGIYVLKLSVNEITDSVIITKVR